MKQSIVALLHILVWLILYGITYVIADTFLGIVSPKYGVIPRQLSFVLAAYTLILIIIPFYLFYFLTPKLFQQKNRLFWYVVAFLSLVLLPVLLLQLDNQNFIPYNYFTALLFLLFFALLGGLFSSFFQWLKQKRLRENIEKQKLRSELDLLRVQLNPHFLFNTLNNIDALIKQNPDKASWMLIQLSSMMRYMLYESQANRVLLRQEVEYLEQFILLQRLRYVNSDTIAFNWVGNAGTQTIAPMLLIPFVENAFKHYKPQTATDKIHINLEIRPPQLYLHCYNRYEPADVNKEEASGIGLSTVKQRLALLYPDKHSLIINTQNTVFDVQLMIVLDETT